MRKTAGVCSECPDSPSPAAWECSFDAGSRSSLRESERTSDASDRPAAERCSSREGESAERRGGDADDERLRGNERGEVRGVRRGDPTVCICIYIYYCAAMDGGRGLACVQGRGSPCVDERKTARDKQKFPKRVCLFPGETAASPCGVAHATSPHTRAHSSGRTRIA